MNKACSFLWLLSSMGGLGLFSGGCGSEPGKLFDGGSTDRAVVPARDIRPAEERTDLRWDEDSAIISDGSLFHEASPQQDSSPGDDIYNPDMSLPDTGTLMDSTPPSICGNGAQESGEVCDDGNTKDGDYCSKDCQVATGYCGDQLLQSNELCDDGITSACSTDHDGGNGQCVPPGTCSSGYVLDVSGNCVTNGTGLSVPCQHGPGWTVFRFHYGGSSKSPTIDVWDATCSYSYVPNSACNVYAVYPGFGEVSYTSDGYPVLTSSEYLRVRFSANGLSFTKTAVYIQARSYATSSSTSFRVWSPLYGDLVGGPVDNDWVYDWYGLDWTGFLYPSDSPSLTAIQVYAYQGSNSLAVKAVELCVE